MDTDRLNSRLTLAANLAVLIGIILLIVELRQNHELMRAQTRNELSVSIINLLSQTANNPELADILNRGDVGEELSAAEHRQYVFNALAFFRYYENVHYQYRQGLYDEQEFQRQRNAWRDFATTTKTAVDVWCARREHFSPEFVADFDALLPPGSCE